MQIVNVKYLCQLPDVAFNRPLPGTHPLRDLTAGEAVGETVENINLAWSEGHLDLLRRRQFPLDAAESLRNVDEILAVKKSVQFLQFIA